MLPSKSGSKYSLKNIMTENIWKIFAPWRGPHLKLLFSTFFQVTVYLVDTQNFRVRWRPLHVFCEYLRKYWSYLIKKNIWHTLPISSNRQTETVCQWTLPSWKLHVFLSFQNGMNATQINFIAVILELQSLTMAW